MKARGILVVDYEFDGYTEAAEEEARLAEALKTLVSGNRRVVHHQMDLKERRGDAPLDIKRMKFRNN